MDIRSRQIGDVVILDLFDRLAARPDGSRLDDEVRRLLDQGHVRILVNLEGVPWVDSSGLGELLAAKKAVLVAGAELKLLRPRRRVVSLIAESGLEKVFECFGDEPSAIRSFGSGERATGGSLEGPTR